MSALVGLVLGLTGLLATGAAVTPAGPRGSTTMRLARAAVWGALAVSAWIPVLFALGIRPAPWNLASLPLLAAAARWGLQRRQRPAPPPVEPATPALSLSVAMGTAVLLLAYGLAVGWMTLSKTMDSPSAAIWAGKAGIFFREGGVPWSFFSDPARWTLHPSYPLGYVFQMIWFHGWMGGDEEWLMQLLPLFWQLLLMALVLDAMPGRGWRGWLARIWGVSLFVGVAALTNVTAFFAEPVLAAFAVLGLRELLLRRTAAVPMSWAPWIILGACGWIKNEGAAIHLAAMAAAWLADRSDWRWRPALAGLAVWLPWRLLALAAGASAADFAWPAGWAGAMRSLSASAAHFGAIAFLEPWRSAGVWWLWLLAVALFPLAFWRDRAAHLLSGFAWFYTAGLVGVYAFSAVPDLQWHVAALDRLLVSPACALALAVGLASQGVGNRFTPGRTVDLPPPGLRACQHGPPGYTAGT
jgi:hypothetical protein